MVSPIQHFPSGIASIMDDAPTTVEIEVRWLQMMEEFIMPAALNHMRQRYELEKSNAENSNL